MKNKRLFVNIELHEDNANICFVNPDTTAPLNDPITVPLEDGAVQNKTLSAAAIGMNLLDFVERLARDEVEETRLPGIDHKPAVEFTTDPPENGLITYHLYLDGFPAGIGQISDEGLSQEELIKKIREMTNIDAMLDEMVREYYEDEYDDEHDDEYDDDYDDGGYYA